MYFTGSFLTFAAMKRTLILILGIVFVLTACSEEGKKESGQHEEARQYSILKDEVEFKWIAYKTSEKIAVPGTFEKINITLQNSEGDIPTLLKGVSFEIDGTSINSNNPERDAKLRQAFVGNWTDSLISGNIQEAAGNGSSGKGTFVLKWNGLEKDLEFTYTIKNDSLFISSEIQMPAWNARSAADSLNAVCKEVHTGKDGKSVLWDNVALKISVPLHQTTAQNIQEATEVLQKTVGK